MNGIVRRAFVYWAAAAALLSVAGMSTARADDGADDPALRAAVAAHANVVLLWMKRRKPACDVGGVEHFVREVVQFGTEPRAAHEHAILGPEHQSTGLPKERRAGLGLEFGPARVGVLHQRHVARILEVRLANDA